MGRCARHGLVAAVCLAVVLPARAGAESGAPSIAIVTIPGAQVGRAVADERSAALVAALAPADVVDAGEARAALSGAASRGALGRAADLARRADVALAAFDALEDTARLLRRAAEAHLDVLPLLESLDAPVRLLVGLATVELALGRDAEVRRALEAAVRLDPDLDLDAQEVSPRLVEALRRARERARDLPVLDGERARAVAQRLGVARLVVVQPRPGPQRTQVEVYSGADGSLVGRWLARSSLAPLAAEIDGAAGAAAGVTRGGGATGATPAARPDDGTPRHFGDAEGDGRGDARERRPWYRRWWFWTLVGAVVAGGAATGVVLGLESGADENLPLQVRGHF
jgi:hypothetical protein